MAKREKVFGDGPTGPLDRNAKARIIAFAKAWNAAQRQPGQHKGPITRTFMEVLEALLWGFHNSRGGRCFPSYEAIAAKAGCARSVVGAALKVLEAAGVLTWSHRLVRVREAGRDFLGRPGFRWRVRRTSNAYLFRDPLSARTATRFGASSTSEKRAGTENQTLIPSVSPRSLPPLDPKNPLEAALLRLGAAVSARTEATAMP